MMQLPERTLTDYEQTILTSVCDKVELDFDFLDDDKFRNLSVPEQYMYLGLTRGMNTVFELFTIADGAETKIIDFLNNIEQKRRDA